MCRVISNQNHRNTSKRTYLLDVLFLNNFLFSDYFDNEVEVKDTSVTARYWQDTTDTARYWQDTSVTARYRQDTTDTAMYASYKIPQLQLGMLHTRYHRYS